jgi:hypothetical protein
MTLTVISGLYNSSKEYNKANDAAMMFANNKVGANVQPTSSTVLCFKVQKYSSNFKKFLLRAATD